MDSGGSPRPCSVQAPSDLAGGALDESHHRRVARALDEGETIFDPHRLDPPTPDQVRIGQQRPIPGFAVHLVVRHENTTVLDR
jgi:hypothetical protein